MVASDNPEITAILLEKGADPKTVLAWQTKLTALHSAATKGNVECIKMLVAAGADANARDNLGQTPLHCAANRSHTDAIETLLRLGSDTNARDCRGNTPWSILFGNMRTNGCFLRNFASVKVLMKHSLTK